MRHTAHVTILLGDQRLPIVRIVDHRELYVDQILDLQRLSGHRAIDDGIGFDELAVFGRRRLGRHPEAGQLLLLAVRHVGQPGAGARSGLRGRRDVLFGVDELLQDFLLLLGGVGRFLVVLHLLLALELL